MGQECARAWVEVIRLLQSIVCVCDGAARIYWSRPAVQCYFSKLERWSVLVHGEFEVPSLARADHSQKHLILQVLQVAIPIKVHAELDLGFY